MNKKLVALGIAAAVGTVGVTGVGVANAVTKNGTDPMSSLVDALASKFNLNKTDVQKVFDEQHATMEATHEQEVKDKLAQLVKDGKLTQAQVDKIIAKQAELKKEREANKDSMKDKTREEMKSAMEAKRTALETWAKDNGIPTEYLRFVIGHGGHGHGPGGPGRGEMMSDQPDA
jgi:hypothetical protein